MILTELQARMFGQAIAVVAHSPPAMALLDKIDRAFKRQVGLDERESCVKSWNDGGCHIFGTALHE